MSELSKLQKRVTELNERVTNLESNIDKNNNNNNNNTVFNINIYETIDKELSINEGILNEISDVLIVKVDKLITKADEKDVITGQPRYGSEKKKIIFQLKNDILKLQSAYQQYVPTIAQQHQFLLSQKEQYENFMRQQEEQRQQEEEKRISQSNNSSATINNTNDEEETRKLAELAEQIRNQKAQEKLQQQMKKEHLLSSLNDITITFYSNNSSNINDNILKAFVNVNTNNSKDTTKKMILMVTQILGNISLHPDNDNLRKMRANNANLQEKLTGYHGGIEMLVSIGFLPKVEDNDDDTNTNTITNSNTNNVLILSLCHNTNCNIYLHTIEPDPEKDMDKW